MTPSNSIRRVCLPYDVCIDHDERTGSARLIRSGLYEELREPELDDEFARVATDSLESLLLALVAAGVELETAAAMEAITTAVDAIAQSL